LANYDEKDGKFYNKVNRDVLVWLARLRLHMWYCDQEPRAWDEEIIYYDIRSEAVFEPMAPLHTTQQMFGSALATSIRIAGGLALDPDHETPNGVLSSGLPAPVRVAADSGIHKK
jgi:hypothetical protein